MEQNNALETMETHNLTLHLSLVIGQALTLSLPRQVELVRLYVFTPAAAQLIWLELSGHQLIWSSVAIS